MDYPAPLATVDGDSISLEDAYDTGIGAWDKVAVDFAIAKSTPDRMKTRCWMAFWRRPPPTVCDSSVTGMRAPLEPHIRTRTSGTMVADAAGRPGARDGCPAAWALDQFDDRVIRTGAPMATLEEVLVPLYLRHRYQVQGTVKLLGRGVHYTYALRGDDTATLPDPVDADDQMDALDGLLATLEPDALRLPEATREMLPPRPAGASAYPRTLPRPHGPDVRRVRALPRSLPRWC